MILTRDGKEITAIYKQDGSEVDEVKDANGRLVYYAAREIVGDLPMRYSGRGKPLTDYLISGNTFQNGTPTPEAPVDVVGCGAWDETHQSYKLPLAVNGTEYPIYLGTVPTTRNIKKLVFDGTENWRQSVNGAMYLSPFTGGSYKKEVAITSMNSHFAAQINTTSGTNEVGDNSSCFLAASGSLEYYIGARSYATAADLKAWLAAQYAAGTPVTVWYVLATPETAVVNEPLMKIGDYADTVSFTQAGMTIPTVSGANVLDMTSPVKPSEVYIKGKGIKAIT